jgi:hypothetical protein
MPSFLMAANIRLFLFHTLLASGPDAPFGFIRPDRDPAPPKTDLATNRGFAVVSAAVFGPAVDPVLCQHPTKQNVPLRPYPFRRAGH